MRVGGLCVRIGGPYVRVGGLYNRVAGACRLILPYDYWLSVFSLVCACMFACIGVRGDVADA